MAKIHWHDGHGEAVILLHGWGMNGAVWAQLVPWLQTCGLRVGVVTLPGYGGIEASSWDDNLALLAQELWRQIPCDCHLLGWSLGGLIATEMALQAPERTRSLCTIASSPCFVEQPEWPGISAPVLARFGQQLQQDLKKTISDFLALQGMGSVSARADIRALKQAIFALPLAEATTLQAGLQLLQSTDQRPQLRQLQGRWLRIYGANDALVPKTTLAQVDEYWDAPSAQAGSRQTQSIVIPEAGHAPFISHFDLVSRALAAFYQ
ncbi:MAG: pimeloyl-ACP methyl ester esterase BioH [Ferrimonas sp.]